jgi:hypothetical protein
MKNRVPFAIVFSVVIVGTVFVLKPMMSDNDISVNISETEEELTLSAAFPRKDSELVHKYLKAQLKMTDLTDLKYLEVKRYQTPNEKMRFHIKSRPGHVKIVFNKTENTFRSYRKLKETCEGLKQLLAHD